jgi:hypothetical protein
MKKTNVFKYALLMMAGVLSGLLGALAAWITGSRAAFVVTFWLAVVVIVFAGLWLRKKHPTLSRMSIAATVMLAVFLAYLLPQIFMPACLGLAEMPTAYACGQVCTSWSPYPCSLCSAAAYAAGTCVGCCWSYGPDPNCTPEPPPPPPPPTATPVPVAPTVSSSLSCNLAGNDGWCRNNAVLNVSAAQSQGYPVSISGFLNGSSNSFSCGTSCSRSLPQGQGTANYTATSAGLTASGSRAWMFDSVAPELSATVSSASQLGNWHTSDVTMTLSATDATSGVNPSSYRWRGSGSWVSGNAHTFTHDGVYSITAEVQDVAGNVGTHTLTIRRDTTPPTVNPAISGTLNNGWYRFNPTVSANASDAMSGIASIEVRVNGGTWSNCTFGGCPVGITTDGTHTLEFRSTDNAGHVSSIRSVTLQRDNTPPVITPHIMPDFVENGWHRRFDGIHFQVSDALSGVAPGTLRHRINAGPWVAGDVPAITEDGIYVIEVQVQDVAGNISNLTINVQRDDTMPDIDWGHLPSFDHWHKAPMTFWQTTRDSLSGVAPGYPQYQLAPMTKNEDGTWTSGGWGPWTPGTSVAFTEEGRWAIRLRSRDIAGNQTTHNIAGIGIDLTPPTFAPEIAPDGQNDWYTSHPVIPLNPHDAFNGLYEYSLAYRLNGGATVERSDSVTIPGDGVYTVRAWIYDNAWNRAEVNFTIRADATPPDLSIDVSSPVPVQNGWHIEPATAEAVASDATSGIDLVEYLVENAVASSARAGRFSPALQSAWVTGDNLVLMDGDHLVYMRVSDMAGNQTVTSERIRVDLTAPTSAFALVDGPVSGVVALAGASFDVHSGVDIVEYSFDDGLTWETVSQHIGGEWAVPFDTTSGPDGEYTIFARATDLAGHTQSAPTSLIVTVNNKPPLPLMTESWWIWESGELSVQPGITPLGEIRLQIACGAQPDVRLTYKDLAKLPSEFTWNRRCGDGHLAPPGDYPVTLTACNIYDKCDTALATIRIPEGQTLTPTPLTGVEPVETPTPADENSEALPPPAKPAAPVIPVVVQEFVEETIVPVVQRWWHLAALSGLLLFAAVVSLTDRRPRALNRLAKTLEKMKG